MKKISRETFRSPASVFIMYLLGSCLIILIFRFIFPGEAPPLQYFSRKWRLLMGLKDILNLFPALALSALILPFCLIRDSIDVYKSFSPGFFKQFSGHITIAICASILYALVFFFKHEHKNNNFIGFFCCIVFI